MSLQIKWYNVQPNRVYLHFNAFQLRHDIRILSGDLWSWKRIWAFTSWNLWGLCGNWGKGRLQNEDMFNLWRPRSSYENRTNAFWHVFSGSSMWIYSFGGQDGLDCIYIIFFRFHSFGITEWVCFQDFWVIFKKTNVLAIAWSENQLLIRRISFSPWKYNLPQPF